MSPDADNDQGAVSISVLGPMMIRQGDRVGSMTGRAAQLAGLFVLHRAEARDESQLVKEMWDGAPKRTAASAFRTYLAALRAAVGVANVVVTDGAYQLSSAVEVDINHFVQLVDQAKQASSPDYSVACHRQALALWRGQPFQSLPQIVLAAERLALEELHDRTVEELMWLRIRLGESRHLVDELQRLVHQRPLREIRTSMLMRVLASEGRTAEALRAYHWLYNHLRDQAGTMPSAELVGLERLLLLGTLEPLPLFRRNALTLAGIAPVTDSSAARSAAIDVYPADRVPLRWQQASFGFVEVGGLVGRLEALDVRVAVVLSAVGYGKTAHAGELAKRLIDNQHTVLCVDAADEINVEEAIRLLLQSGTTPSVTVVIDDVHELAESTVKDLIIFVEQQPTVSLRLFGDTGLTAQAFLSLAGPAVLHLQGLDAEAIVGLNHGRQSLAPWEVHRLHWLCQGHPGDIRALLETIGSGPDLFDLAALRRMVAVRLPRWATSLSDNALSLLAKVCQADTSTISMQTFQTIQLDSAPFDASTDEVFKSTLSIANGQVAWLSPLRKLISEASIETRLGRLGVPSLFDGSNPNRSASFTDAALGVAVAEFVRNGDADAALMAVDRHLEVVAEHAAEHRASSERRIGLLELLGNVAEARQTRLGLLRRTNGRADLASFNPLLHPELSGRSFEADRELEPYLTRAIDYARAAGHFDVETMLHAEWVTKSALDPTRLGSTNESIVHLGSVLTCDLRTRMFVDRALHIVELTRPNGEGPQREDLDDLIARSIDLDDTNVESGAVSLSLHSALASADKAWWDRSLLHHEELALRTRRPADLWVRDACRATNYLLHGQLVQARTHAEEAFQTGQRYSVNDATIGHDTFCLSTAWGQSMLGDLSQWSLVRLDDELAFAQFSLVLKASFERTIDPDSHTLTEVVNAALSVDNDFFALPLLAMVAQSVSNLGAGHLVGRLCSRLEDSQREMISVGLPPVACFGPTSRYLALLKATIGDNVCAYDYLDKARAVATKFGSASWLAILRRDHQVLNASSQRL
jgi:DNA-binding SARP family transcriptional activator